VNIARMIRVVFGDRSIDPAGSMRPICLSEPSSVRWRGSSLGVSLFRAVALLPEG
jgi:hypothetical protein